MKTGVRAAALCVALATGLMGAPGCDSGSSGGPTAPRVRRQATTQAQCLGQANFGSPASSPYCLPYAVGSAYTVTQSYCSPPPRSHNLRFAYDFDMPMGTELLAARAGELVELREHFSDADTQGGRENVAILRHDDDTLGLYIHMRQNGVVPELGDFVPKGGLVGYSGSSGTGFPHLHFQVCLRGGVCSTGTNEITQPVNFRNAQGPHDSTGGLMEGATYAAGSCS